MGERYIIWGEKLFFEAEIHTKGVLGDVCPGFWKEC